GLAEAADKGSKLCLLARQPLQGLRPIGIECRIPGRALREAETLELREAVLEQFVDASAPQDVGDGGDAEVPPGYEAQHDGGDVDRRPARSAGCDSVHQRMPPMVSLVKKRYGRDMVIARIASREAGLARSHPGGVEQRHGPLAQTPRLCRHCCGSPTA